MKIFNVVKQVALGVIVVGVISCGSSKKTSNGEKEVVSSSANEDKREARQEARQQLLTDLNLRGDQKLEVQAIVQESQEKMRNLRNSDGDRRSKMQQMQTLSSETDTELRAILDDRQFQVYQEFKQKQREEIRAQMQNRSGRRRG